MKALYVNEPGAEPDLEVRDVPVPGITDNQVLVRVAACGLCNHDVAVMAGLLHRGVSKDVILGHEISGFVDRVGASVHAFSEGDRVVATLTAFCGKCDRCLAGHQYRCREGQGVGHGINGGFAQYVALPETSLVPVPDGLDLVDACVAACPIGVTIQAISDVARVKPGETVLVVGAGGGLGIHAIQVAAAGGARVIAVTTSLDKMPAIESLGADVVLSTKDLDFSEIVFALTGDEGVDVILNTVGSAVLESCLASLAQFGRMVILGEVEGAKIGFNITDILFLDATMSGSTGASPSHIASALDMMSSGKVKPVIHQQLGLAEATEAFQLVRSRGATGRIVLIPPAE
jgi:D-arabinose 1-dehydrogenase-like Zn-dependent alcohol dehydrogenase